MSISTFKEPCAEADALYGRRLPSCSLVPYCGETYLKVPKTTHIGIYINGIKVTNKTNPVTEKFVPSMTKKMFNPVTWNDEVREGHFNYPRKNTVIRGKVTGFSKKSRKRLSWLYNQYPWKSMITFTYHLQFPEDGKESKYHLRELCKEFKKKNIVYLWVLEWQGRGFPHYHVWLSRELTYDEVQYFGKRWIQITKKYNNTQEAYAFHQWVDRIYTKWTVKIGVDYALKYAEKSEQKGLPLNVDSYGRWYGKSRDLEIIPELEEIFDSEKPEDDIKRFEMIRFNRNVHRCIRHWKKKTVKRKKRSAVNGFYYLLSVSRKAAIERLYKYHKENINTKMVQYGFL